MAPSDRERTRPRRSLVPALIAVLCLQGCFYLGLQAAPWTGSVVRLPVPREDSAARQTRWRELGYNPGLEPTLGSSVPAFTLPRLPRGSISLSGAAGKDTLVIFLPEYG